MEEQLISFETAKLAKEKGYNETCWHLYRKDGTSYYTSFLGEADAAMVPCITQSLLQKWLRDKHSIMIKLNPYWNTKKDCSWSFGIHMKQGFNSPFYETYEEALEEGLKEALKLI